MKDFFFKKTNVILLLFAVAILAFSCQNDAGDSSNANNPTKSTKSTDNSASDNSPKETTAKLDETKDYVYAWVDKLNIRDAASTKGKAITAVQSNDALELTGERSSKSEEIVLRGVVYNDTWIKVITPDKKEGWVFGGAVKKKGEKKGNDPITDTQFDFVHFGKFDLSNWKVMGSNDGGGGDAESDTRIYQKGNQTFEVTNVEMGEYGYARHYTLKEGGKVLKKRSAMFSADADPMVLSVAVTDYTVSPAKEYTRSQKIENHYFNLNPRPVIATGAWTINDLN